MGHLRRKDGAPEFWKAAPSALTLLGLCAGVTAIRFALSGHWSASLACLTAAAILDMMDGRLARLLGAESALGAQLDSLADLVSFGVAPAMIVYAWSLSALPETWAVSLLFVVCCAVRLARFNCEAAHGEKPDAFFVGLPAPGAAGLALLPLLLQLQFKDAATRAPLLNAGLMCVISLLMVSRLPTPSLKPFAFGRANRPALAVCAVAVAALAIRWPWATASTGWAVYALSVPIGAAAAKLGVRPARTSA